MKKIFIFLITTVIAVSVSGQCLPDKHNTTWYDEWISCEPSENPNSENNASHWIMYDFGYEMKINGMHIWNCNVPSSLNFGIKNALIEYSDNATDWTKLDTFEFEKGTGLNDYQGFDLPEFDSFEAKYILITALDNYGGNCYGLSEIRFNFDSTYLSVSENDDKTGFSINIFPNPFNNRISIKINSSKDKKIVWYITDAQGRRITDKTTYHSPGNKNITLKTKAWEPGFYLLVIKQGDVYKRIKLIKTSK